MSDEEFYSADEHEEDVENEASSAHHHSETVRSENEPKQKINEDAKVPVKDEGNLLVEASSQSLPPNDRYKEVSIAQNLAGYLCAGTPTRSEPQGNDNSELKQYMQETTSANDLASLSSNNNNNNHSVEKQAAENEESSRSQSGETTNDQSEKEASRSDNLNKKNKNQVYVTQLDVPAFLDLSDDEGYRYTSYRISITRSDGKVTHVLRRFNEVSEAYFSILNDKVLNSKHHKELKNYNFPHKSLLNTFASHTLERRRVGFANFLKLLLNCIKKGDTGCVEHLATLLAINPKMFNGTSQMKQPTKVVASSSS